MKKTIILLGGLALAANAIAGGDIEAGKTKSQRCAACHGKKGNSQAPNFPKLAGQRADYMVHALKAYKSGERENAVMKGQVTNLSEQDMQDLAAYFASQQGLVTPDY